MRWPGYDVGLSIFVYQITYHEQLYVDEGNKLHFSCGGWPKE